MSQLTTASEPLPATPAEALERIERLLAGAHGAYVCAADEPEAWRALLGAITIARRLALAALGRLRPLPGEKA